MRNNYEFYKKKNQDLLSLAENSENWYGYDDEDSKTFSQEFFNQIRKLSLMCTSTILKESLEDGREAEIVEHQFDDDEGEDSDNLQEEIEREESHVFLYQADVEINNERY